MRQSGHDAIVQGQFSPQARAYLASAVHAAGADLDRLEQVAARPGARVLDLGAGAGHVSFRLAPRVARVVACDPSAAMLAVVAEEAGRRGLGNLETVTGMAERLPFPAAAFDLVASRYSAHHWRDLAAGLGEVRRVLKPGGLAVFVYVAAPEAALLDTWLQGIELLRDPSHVRNRTLAQWRALLAAAGLAPGAAEGFRLRLEFASWVERMRTPAAHVAAIRSLQRGAPAEVADHFALEADGSFTVDTLLIAATAGD